MWGRMPEGRVFFCPGVSLGNRWHCEGLQRDMCRSVRATKNPLQPLVVLTGSRSPPAENTSRGTGFVGGVQPCLPAGRAIMRVLHPYIHLSHSSLPHGANEPGLQTAQYFAPARFES